MSPKSKTPTRTPTKQQASFFGEEGEALLATPGRRRAVPVTALLDVGDAALGKDVAGDEQFEFGCEDRRRAAARPREDGDEGSGDEGGVSGKAVFAFETLVARENRQRKKKQQQTQQQQQPTTPRGILTPSRRLESQHKKSVVFSPQLEAPATPSHRSRAPSNLRAKDNEDDNDDESPAASPTATPSTPKTPKLRTPDARLRASRRLRATVAQDDASDDEEEDDSENESESDNESEEDEEQEPLSSLPQQPDTPSRFKSRESDYDRDVQRRGKTRANVEDYFADGTTTVASKTSNNTLASLPVLPRPDFLASLHKMPFKHAHQRNQLAALLPTHFPQWNHELSQGFNLLLFGYGSKRSLLTSFKESQNLSSHYPVLTLNGYMPSINLTHDLLAKLSTSLLQKDPAKPLGSPATQIRQIAEYLSSPTRQHTAVYLLINSIDGPALRTKQAQLILQSLVESCPRDALRVVATIDHINAPLLWDRQAADRFHWVWKDATTYQEYFVETQWEGMVMVEAGARKGANGAVHVLRSLNSNARRMFKILAESQVAAAGAVGGDDIGGGEEEEDDAGNKKSGGKSGGKGRKKRRVVSKRDDGDEDFDGVSDADSDDNPSPRKRSASSSKTTTATTATTPLGLSYYTFLTQCIENFCVNSQDNFKAQLAEFRDHQIILSKRGFQGEEVLYIPFETSVLVTLLGQITV
ncbi:Origin recognition complex subunit 2 [Podochytrium sp. JEL0797]|nr:Origin recognition complex subunit 2 [Podochytrium sp. JEL0797]